MSSLSFEVRHARARLLRRPERIQQLTRFETLETVIREPVSLARFGDGELAYCFKKKSLKFQPWHPDLSERLQQCLMRHVANLLPCFNNDFEKNARIPWILSLERSRKDYEKIESTIQQNDTGILLRTNEQKSYQKYWQIINAESDNPVFGDATVFFLGLYHAEYAAKRLDLVKSLFAALFANKRILFVCPDEPLMGASLVHQEDAMKHLGLKSAQFIAIPNINAFAAYDDVRRQIEASRGFDEIFVQAGPMATALALDLTERLNVRTIDAGSLNVQLQYLSDLERGLEVPHAI